ncbi:MAG: DMT family transporter [Shimia sp.]
MGAAIIAASAVAMALADAVVKGFLAEVTLWQLFSARAAVAILVMAVAFGSLGGRFALVAPNWVILRTLCVAVTWLLFYAALPVLDLALAAVAIYVHPIFATLFTRLFGRDRIGLRHWAGVLVGFAGVAVILSPGHAAPAAVVLPLAAAAFYALGNVLTRTRCAAERPEALAFAVNGLLLGLGLGVSLALALAPPLGGAPFLTGPWAPLAVEGWLVIGMLGILSTMTLIGVAWAYQLASPATVATFEYLYVPAAALWGVVLLAERPEMHTLSGLALIGLAGVLASDLRMTRQPLPATR